MQNLRDAVIQSHIRENYPDAQIVSWEDPECQLSFYTAEELKHVRNDWFPLCCCLPHHGTDTVYGGRSKVTHTYIQGETGAGKTSRFAMQSIRALSCLPHKPSFLVVDIHGELVENLHDLLTKNGYAVKILNCDEPSRSDTYNPFASLVRRCLESGTIDHEAHNEIRKISEIIQPVISTKDPVWEQGARSYTNGLILDKFEDLLKGDIPPESITLYNIIQNHYWLRGQLSQSMLHGDLLRIDHYKEKGTQALSIQKMLSVTNNAEKTRASYYGVIENRYDSFGQPSLYQLSSRSTIDVTEFIQKPTAIFIQSGSTQVGENLASMMVNEIYNTAIRMGRKSATKQLPRKIHCFLDEFANSNIADGPEFIKMLTTSRKFGMYWHILLQCDAQLDRKYDPDIARIIRANCTELFMGSNDYETMVRFAKSCGMRTVESLGSRVTHQAPVLETVELITADKLSLMDQGVLYIKASRHPLLCSYIEAFYNCAEFRSEKDILSVYPVNDFDYTTTAFFPDDIPPAITDEEFQVLRHIYKNDRVDSFDLDDLFADKDVTGIVHRLEKLKLVAEDTDRELVVSHIDKETFAVLEQKHAHVPEPVLKEKEEKEEAAASESLTGHTLRSMTKNVAEAVRAALAEQNLSELDLRRTLRQCRCISPRIYNAFMYLAGYYPEGAEDVKILDSKTLHFEMMDAFFRSYDFKTKAEWVECIRYEYGYAVITPIFPRAFTLAYAKVMREITKELTIEDILQIKKVINDTQQD